MTSRPRGVLLAAAVAIVACSCGGKSGDASAWVWPNGDLSSTRSVAGSSITASLGRKASRRLAFPRSRERRRLRASLVDPAHAGRGRVRAGHVIERLRARPRHRPQALGTAKAGAERRSQRARARRRPALRGQRHLGLRSRPRRRARALEHAARQPDGAVRQHRAGRRSRPGVREHRRASTRRPRSDLRARRSHGQAALAVRHDQGAVAEPEGGRWRRLAAPQRRRQRPHLCGHRQPRPRGAGRRGTRTAAGTAGRRSTPTRSSSSTAPPASSSGTTRCCRTTSGTTTSSSRRSSQPWRDGIL